MNVVDKPTVDTIVLDETILNDEPRCEITHLDPSRCSITVTHRIISCNSALLICETASRSKSAEMAAGNRCARCKRAAADCWRIVTA